MKLEVDKFYTKEDVDYLIDAACCVNCKHHFRNSILDKPVCKILFNDDNKITDGSYCDLFES